MNGFISKKALRFNLMALGCLLSGFVSGNRLPSISDLLFAKTEIHFEKISWMSDLADQNPVQFATVDYPEVTLKDAEIYLADFQLKTAEKYRITDHGKKFKVPRKSNFHRLELALNLLNQSVYDDYLSAHASWIREFKILAMNNRTNKEIIQIARSSARIEPELYEAPVIPKQTIQIRHAQTIKPSYTKNLKSQIKKSWVKVKKAKSESEGVPIIKSSAEPVISIPNETVAVAEVEKTKTKSEPVMDQRPAVDPIASPAVKVSFIKPEGNKTGLNNQVYPMRQEWISKSWNDYGWKKFEFDGYYPLLTYYPNQNQNELMLLDQNALAMIALKAGVHLSNETGMLLGNVPSGYQVEYSGRSEEVEYFDMNGKRFFVVLNAEPGSGVIELVSNQNSQIRSSVFAPVLKQVVTYLDLGEPLKMNLPVRVTKNEISNPSPNQVDLEGLTVSLSTQNSVSTQTDSSGKATLNDVYLIPGYPVFLDVNAKWNGKSSYQYRYHLSKRNKLGEFILKQYPEKMLYSWIKKTQQSIGASSGMIIGEINHSQIRGFKKFHFASVKTLGATEKSLNDTYSILWNGNLSDHEPLEGDHPRFLSVDVAEGLSQVIISDDESHQRYIDLIPVSSRVISVISE